MWDWIWVDYNYSSNDEIDMIIFRKNNGSLFVVCEIEIIVIGNLSFSKFIERDILF